MPQQGITGLPLHKQTNIKNNNDLFYGLYKVSFYFFYNHMIVKKVALLSIEQGYNFI